MTDSNAHKLIYWLRHAWSRPDAKYKYITYPEVDCIRLTLQRIAFPEEKRLKQNAKARRDALQFSLADPIHGHLARHRLAAKWYNKGFISQPNVNGKYREIRRNGKWELTEFGKQCASYRDSRGKAA